MKILDMAAVMNHSQFRGMYGGYNAHQNDQEIVLNRGKSYGVRKYFFTASCFNDAEFSYKLSLKSDHYYATIGVHPTRAIDPFRFKKGDESGDGKSRDELLDEYFEKMTELIEKSEKEKFVAIGECGLDYERLFVAEEEVQKKVFVKHFELAKKFHLPMFLHSRSSENDFIDIVKAHRDDFPGGVVHCFTGTEKEMKDILDLDLYIGLTGLSFRTEENIDVIKKIPPSKILVATYSPFCMAREDYAGAKHIKTSFKFTSKEYYKTD